MAIRASTGQFIAAILARSHSGSLYTVATVNGQQAILRNGAVLYQQFTWSNTTPNAGADPGGGNADTVTLVSPDGSVSTGDAQSFINSLT